MAGSASWERIAAHRIASRGPGLLRQWRLGRRGFWRGERLRRTCLGNRGRRRRACLSLGGRRQRLDGRIERRRRQWRRERRGVGDLRRAGASAPQAKAWAVHKSTTAKGPPRMPVSLANHLEISPRWWHWATRSSVLALQESVRNPPRHAGSGDAAPGGDVERVFSGSHARSRRARRAARRRWPGSFHVARSTPRGRHGPAASLPGGMVPSRALTAAVSCVRRSSRGGVNASSQCGVEMKYSSALLGTVSSIRTGMIGRPLATARSTLRLIYGDRSRAARRSAPAPWRR